MPKYLHNSTGDEFFVSDSSRFYYDDLQGPKYLRYFPNTGHGLNNDGYSTGVSGAASGLVAMVLFLSMRNAAVSLDRRQVLRRTD